MLVPRWGFDSSVTGKEITMSPQAVEMHLIILFLMVLLVLGNVVIVLLTINIYGEIKAIRAKLRLMGFKLDDNSMLSNDD